MKKICHIAILALAALIAASPFNCPAAATVTLGDGHSTPASDSIPVTSTPNPVSITGADGSTDYMTISISFLSNAGGPAPVGNLAATILSYNSLTRSAFQIRRAGSFGPNTDYRSSNIEGSLIGPPDIDVGYLDSYSVPITCASEGTAFSDYNIDLFKQPGSTYNSQVGGPVCLNSEHRGWTRSSLFQSLRRGCLHLSLR